MFMVYAYPVASKCLFYQGILSNLQRLITINEP